MWMDGSEKVTLCLVMFVVVLRPNREADAGSSDRFSLLLAHIMITTPLSFFIVFLIYVMKLPQCMDAF